MTEIWKKTLNGGRVFRVRMSKKVSRAGISERGSFSIKWYTQHYQKKEDILK